MHSGADMDTALEMARGSLDGDLQWNISDLLQNRNEWWVPGKLVDLRERLASSWKVNLESFASTSIPLLALITLQFLDFCHRIQVHVNIACASSCQ